MVERFVPFGSLLEYPLRSGVTVAKDVRGQGIRMVNMRELFKYPRLGNVDMEHVSIDVTDSERFLIREGDLLFARRSLTAEGAGRCALVIDAHEDTTWESSIIRARLNPYVADPEYFYYFFSSSVGRQSVGTIIEQVAAAGIRSSDLAKLVVPLPSRAEQLAVASVLSVFDKKIAINNQVARKCHELAQAHALQAYAHAPIGLLSEIAQITMGSSPPGESYNEYGIGMPFYQGTRDFGERFPARRVWCSTPVRTAEAGSTLVSVRAPVGRLNIAYEMCCIGRGVAGLESTRGTPSGLFHMLAAESGLWRPYEAEGTVFGAINRRQLAALPIPVLDASKASKLEDILRSLDRRLYCAFRENMILAEFRDTLLSKLMSGEIRVRDAEKVVEEAT